MVPKWKLQTLEIIKKIFFSKKNPCLNYQNKKKKPKVTGNNNNNCNNQVKNRLKGADELN